MKKVQLEMGGKNPFVILDDADLKVAVEASVNGAFFSTGQRCTASSRLIVTEGIHDKFVAALTERIRHLKVGDALDKATEIGPVVDPSQLKQDTGYIEVGKQEGAKLVVTDIDEAAVRESADANRRIDLIIREMGNTVGQHQADRDLGER